MSSPAGPQPQAAATVPVAPAGTGTTAPGPAPAGRTRAGGPRPHRLALALMVSAQFMVILDSAIVNVALPTIQRSLGFSAVGVEGVITAYAIAFGGVLILGGRLADLLGRRRMFAAGLAGFGVTSLACALATSPAVLIAARVLQGLSAAALAPAALALVVTTFAEGHERNRALGVFGIATSLGFVCGQVLGGLLAATAGWRAVFLVNVPVAVLAVALTYRALSADPPRPARRVPDIPGAALITAGMALAVWAPARGAQDGWGSPQFLVPLAAAIGLLAVFGLAETRRRDPLIRLGMLRSRWVAGANLVTAATGILNGATMLICTLYLQQAHGYSPLLAGVCFIPAGLAGLLAGARLAGRLVTRLGVRAVLGGGSLVSAVMAGGLSLLQGNGSYWPLLPWLIGIGASFTTCAVATTVATSAGVARDEQGMAAGVRQTSFQLGVALGVAVLLSIAASRTSAISAHSPHLAASAALTSGFRLSLRILAVISLIAAALSRAMLTRLAPGQPGGGGEGR
jgi:EmrB/QacA subfamily drug resistance transporter